jgi:hypothetical protein
MGWQLPCFVRLNPCFWLSQRVPRAELDGLRGSWWNCLDFDARPRFRWLHFDVGLDFVAATTTGRHAHQVAVPLALALSEALQPDDLCIRSR